MSNLLTAGFSKLIAGPVIPSSEPKAQPPYYSHMIWNKSYWIIIKNSTGIKTRSHSVPSY